MPAALARSAAARRALLALALALAMLVLRAPAPVAACSCSPLYGLQLLEMPEVMVVGRIEAVSLPYHPYFTRHYFGLGARAVMRVERYLKGTGKEIVAVRDVGGSSCAFLRPQVTGRDYLVVLEGQEGHYVSSLCLTHDLTYSDGPEVLAKVIATTGPGTAPLPGGGTPSGWQLLLIGMGGAGGLLATERMLALGSR